MVTPFIGMANANLNRRLLVQILRLLFIAKNATVKAVGFQVLVIAFFVAFHLFEHV